jgi:hypothetical protein
VTSAQFALTCSPLPRCGFEKRIYFCLGRWVHTALLDALRCHRMDAAALVAGASVFESGLAVLHARKGFITVRVVGWLGQRRICR